MKKGSGSREHRRSPRVLIKLPLDIQIIGPEVYVGVAFNASETGLFIQTLKEMAVGTKLRISLFLPDGSGRKQIDAIAEIVWKDVGLWEDLEGYQYGLKFIQISNEDYQELKHILNKLLNLEFTLGTELRGISSS
jgi:hypothetical protein